MKHTDLLFVAKQLGNQEACPKICRKEMGRVTGDRSWGLGWSLQAWLQENLGLV